MGLERSIAMDLGKKSLLLPFDSVALMIRGRNGRWIRC